MLKLEEGRGWGQQTLVPCPISLVLYSLQAKNHCCIFKWLKQSKSNVL